MRLRIETPTKLTSRDLEMTAALTSAGFGRTADEANYEDTRAHIETADYLQIMHDDERLAAFAAYRRPLWQPGC